MSKQTFKYVIAGAGVAGASAVAGIREVDGDGSILLVGDESVLAYDRPDLTKKLWFGKKKIEAILRFDSSFYIRNNVDVSLGIQLSDLDARAKTIADQNGNEFRYEKLLLATGGVPRKLDIPGGDTWGISYYRYINDYLRIRRDAAEGKSAVVIGGGFIGSELAAVLTENKVAVTMVFPGKYLVSRIFPESLGNSIQDHFREKGVTILNEDVPTSIEKNGAGFVVHTRNGKNLEADIVIAGLGLDPATDLAEKAGLRVENGIAVDTFLKTSDSSIYAAGDIAYFPYTALGRSMRVEHWDNALNQGKQAGRNMAGAGEPYDYMPYFWSDLFEFGYEAVGDLSSKLQTFGDWQKENDTGVLYYMDKGRVRGVMTCNIYGKMDDARKLILDGKEMTPDTLRGAIKE